jgi:hypothetical protein
LYSHNSDENVCEFIGELKKNLIINLNVLLDNSRSALLLVKRVSIFIAAPISFKSSFVYDSSIESQLLECKVTFNGLYNRLYPDFMASVLNSWQAWEKKQ